MSVLLGSLATIWSKCGVFLYYTVHCTGMNYTLLYCTVLNCTILYCTVYREHCYVLYKSAQCKETFRDVKKFTVLYTIFYYTIEFTETYSTWYILYTLMDLTLRFNVMDCTLLYSTSLYTLMDLTLRFNVMDCTLLNPAVDSILPYCSTHCGELTYQFSILPFLWQH